MRARDRLLRERLPGGAGHPPRPRGHLRPGGPLAGRAARRARRGLGPARAARPAGRRACPGTAWWARAGASRRAPGPAAELQRRRLQAEGVRFRAGAVDLRRHGLDCRDRGAARHPGPGERARHPARRWCAAGRPGVLRFTRGALAKTVYLSEGRLIFATSNDPDDRLGEMLLRKGRITYRALEESVRAISDGKRQGTILVESGAIRSARPRGGRDASRSRRSSTASFGWEEGAYEFVEGDLPSREVILLRMSTAGPALEGIRRVERWSRIRAGVGAARPALRALAPTPPPSSARCRSTSRRAGAWWPASTASSRWRRSARPRACRTSWSAARCGGCGRRASSTACPRTPDEHARAGEDRAPRGAHARAPPWAARSSGFNALHRFLYELVTYELRERRGRLLRAGLRARRRGAPGAVRRRGRGRAPASWTPSPCGATS